MVDLAMMSRSLLLLSWVGASIAALTNPNSPAVVCIAGQCVQGFTNLSMGSLLSAPGSPTSLLLLPGSYSSTTNPQLLHTLLTSSSASLSSSAGFPNSTGQQMSLPLAVQLQPGIAAYEGANYTGSSAFVPLDASAGVNTSTNVNAGSVVLSPNTFALLSSPASTSQLTIYDSIPDLAQLPSSSSFTAGQLSVLALQSTVCQSPCASGGVCSPSSSSNSTQPTCTCAPGFTGSSCESCLPGHFGPACTPCSSSCAQCADGIAGSGVCLTLNVTNSPSSCNCQNGVCDGSGGCTCNAGYTTASNGTLCSACADGFFQADDGTCKVCALGCASCAASSGACITCQSGFTQSPTSPSTCVPSTSSTTTSSGTLCPDGSFSNGTACAPCSPLCSTCTGPTSADCVVCGAGRVGFKGASGGAQMQCVQTDASGVCQISNTASGSTTANSTTAGFVADNSAKLCTPCPASCSSCGIPNFSVASTIDQVQCSACLPGFALTSAGKCVETCPAGTVQSGGKCVACDASCSTCAGTPGFCLTCTNNLLASNGTCLSSCPANTFASTAACTACHPDCATCSGPGFDQCSTCPPSRPVKANGRCLPACPAKNTFFDKAQGACVSCDASCATCSGSGSQSCLSCANAGSVLRAGTCVKASCSSNTTVVPGLGACLSDLVLIPDASTPASSGAAPLPTITGLTQPTTATPTSSNSVRLAWWQILLMALGLVFLVLLALGCWRRRQRKRRALETRAFARQKNLDVRMGWGRRLVQWGERLFGHDLGKRALRLGDKKTRARGMEMEMDAGMREGPIALRGGDLEDGRGGRERGSRASRDMDTILDAYGYRDYDDDDAHPHSHHLASSPHATRQNFASRALERERDLNRLSGASLYTEITGQARRTADVRQPMRERGVLLASGGSSRERSMEKVKTDLSLGARDLDVPRPRQNLQSRFSGSTYSFASSSHSRSSSRSRRERENRDRTPTPAEEYALSILDTRFKDENAERAVRVVHPNPNASEPDYGLLGELSAAHYPQPQPAPAPAPAPFYPALTTTYQQAPQTQTQYTFDNPPPRGQFWLRPTNTGDSAESKKSKNPFLR